MFSEMLCWNMQMRHYVMVTIGKKSPVDASFVCLFSRLHTVVLIEICTVSI